MPLYQAFALLGLALILSAPGPWFRLAAGLALVAFAVYITPPESRPGPFKAPAAIHYKVI